MYNILLISIEEAAEYSKKRINSLLLYLPKPSAILFIVDNAALLIWS